MNTAAQSLALEYVYLYSPSRLVLVLWICTPLHMPSAMFGSSESSFKRRAERAFQMHSSTSSALTAQEAHAAFLSMGGRPTLLLRRITELVQARVAKKERSSGRDFDGQMTLDIAR